MSFSHDAVQVEARRTLIVEEDNESLCWKDTAASTLPRPARELIVEGVEVGTSVIW